jgi:hypothetical protein
MSGEENTSVEKIAEVPTTGEESSLVEKEQDIVVDLEEEEQVPPPPPVKRARTLEEEDLDCPTCHKNFADAATLEEHTHSVHLIGTDKSFPCPECDKAFNRKSTLYVIVIFPDNHPACSSIFMYPPHGYHFMKVM